MGSRAHLATLVETMKTLRGTAVVEHRGVRRFATSYPELAAMAERFAAELNRRGIEPGERVLLWGRNSAAWMAAFWGCVLRGVLPVPLDAAGSVEFARRVASETAPKLLVGDRVLPLSGLGVFTLFFDELEHLQPGPAPPLPELGPDTPLQILFTSGTTGEPKGVVHTHGNLLASLDPIEREIVKYRKYERLVHPLRFLHTLPLSHVFGQFMDLWVPPLLGAQVHYEDRTARMSGLLSRERVHVLAAVPRTLALIRAQLLVEFPALDAEIEAAQGVPLARRWWRFRRVHRLLGLQFWAMVCGGATLPPELERFWTTLGFALVQGYGLTETAALVTLNHPFKTARGSVGALLPGRSVRVSEGGELEVSGPMVATGSWEQGGFQKRADPWLRTGDLASVENGRMRFLGRTGQRLVTSAGLNVYLQDVEQALERQPDVAGAVVFGLGDEPATVVAARGDVEAVVDAANRELAVHQRVRHWWQWPGLDLPRTATGKVRRSEVEAWARAQASSGAEASSGEDAATTLLMEAGARRGPFSDEARLEEDWGLDSMGRVALASALEERAGVSGGDAAQTLHTLGELRKLLRGASRFPAGPKPDFENEDSDHKPMHLSPRPDDQAGVPAKPHKLVQHGYPTWPWSALAVPIRLAFTELLLRPLVFVLARPRVIRSAPSLPAQPMLLISNHRTAIDAALLLYALPFPVRHRVAIMMSGEILTGLSAGWSLRPLPPASASCRGASPVVGSAGRILPAAAVQYLSAAASGRVSRQLCPRRARARPGDACAFIS